MNRYCDGATGNRQCPHPEECNISCQFNDSTAIPIHSKKIISLPEIYWDGIQTYLVWVTWFFVLIIIFGWLMCLTFLIGKLI